MGALISRVLAWKGEGSPPVSISSEPSERKLDF